MSSATWTSKKRKLFGVENQDLTGESVVGLKPLHVLLANYKVIKPTPLSPLLFKNNLQLIDTTNKTYKEQNDIPSPVSIILKEEINTG